MNPNTTVGQVQAPTGTGAVIGTGQPTTPPTNVGLPTTPPTTTGQSTPPTLPGQTPPTHQNPVEFDRIGMIGQRTGLQLGEMIKNCKDPEVLRGALSTVVGNFANTIVKDVLDATARFENQFNKINEVQRLKKRKEYDAFDKKVMLGNYQNGFSRKEFDLSAQLADDVLEHKKETVTAPVTAPVTGAMNPPPVNNGLTSPTQNGLPSQQVSPPPPPTGSAPLNNSIEAEFGPEAKKTLFSFLDNAGF